MAGKKKGNGGTATRTEQPPLDLGSLSFSQVARPQSSRGAVPAMLNLHNQVLATRGTHTAGQPQPAIEIALPAKADGKALVSQIRSTIRKNGYADVSIVATYGKDQIQVWATDLRKRASRKGTVAPPGTGTPPGE
jgi:hypothetical protein